MKILLPIDTSDCTTRMFEHLDAHPELLQDDHDFTVFTVVDPVAAGTGSSGMSMDAAIKERAERVLAPARAFAQQHGWRLQADHVPGPVVQAIVAKAEALQADLIVMGTHARSPLGTVMLGSVANGVLAACRVPVLLVR